MLCVLEKPNRIERDIKILFVWIIQIRTSKLIAASRFIACLIRFIRLIEAELLLEKIDKSEYGIELLKFL